METRKLFLDGIQLIAVNMGRVAGLPDDKLPEVILSKESTPPTVNNSQLVNRLRTTWDLELESENVLSVENKGMGAEDSPYFSSIPAIKSFYFDVGGTPAQYFQIAASGGSAIPSHHSPLFKIAPKPSVIMGTEATIYALLELMPKQ